MTIKKFFLKTAMILPALLLQRPHPESKTKNHIACLTSRFALWKRADLMELLLEGKSVQRNLQDTKMKRDKQKSSNMIQTFFKLMMEGRRIVLFRQDSKGGFGRQTS